MNSHVKGIMHIGSDKSALLAAAYYGAYPIASFFVGQLVISRCGYRPTFLAGLTIFGVGNFLVAAAARALSLGGMVGAFFVIGLGIATLERSANPYTVRCGPTASRAIRINMAQAMAGLGTVVAPLVAKVFLLKEDPKAKTAGTIAARMLPDVADAMNSVVTLYQGVGAIVLGIAVVFSPIFFRTQWVPEVPIEQSIKTHGFRRHPIWRNMRLWLGAFANFWNMGCQVTVAQNVLDYGKEIDGATLAQGAVYLSIAQALFVVGRFTFAGLCKFFKLKPRHVLLGFNLGCMASSTAAIFLPGKAGIAMLSLIMFFEGPMFPTIFETATTGLEEFASLGEDIMIASISGGALLPPLFGLLSDAIGVQHNGTAKAFALIVSGFSLILVYVLPINTYKAFQLTLDVAYKAREMKGDTNSLEAMQTSEIAVGKVDLKASQRALSATSAMAVAKEPETKEVQVQTPSQTYLDVSLRRGEARDTDDNLQRQYRQLERNLT